MSAMRSSQLRLKMRSPLLIALFLLLARSAQAKFIDRLSYDDLSSVVGPGPAMLIFTAGWCAHCKAVQPEIAVLAKAVKNNPDITIARVDAEEEPAIVTKFRVQSFPTFLYTPPGFSLKGKIAEPEEFSDYRWAELMAEFVNNETKTETVKLTPRKKFLTWREKVPFNKGKQPRQTFAEPEAPTPHPEGLDPIEGAAEAGFAIRDPIVLGSAREFDQVVVQNETESFAVYFYTRNDPMQRDYLIQWRQAASAFQPDDHVALAMVNVENADSGDIAKRYGVADTPAVLYFARCNSRAATEKADYQCKKPVPCGEGCADTDEIITFVSEQMSAENGALDATGGEDGGEMLQLTDEQYQELMKQGNIFPVDATDEEIKAASGDDEVHHVEHREYTGPSEKIKVGADVDGKVELEGKVEL